MEYLKSELPKAEYLAELKGCFASPFDFFRERVTGLVMGPFFSVAHHTDYEWDRRYNSVSTRAWGYVRERKGKTEVRVLRWHGMLTPFWVVLFLAFWTVLFVGLLEPGERMGIEIWLAILIASLLPCLMTAFGAIVTERGEYSHGELTKLLRNPKDYYC